MKTNESGCGVQQGIYLQLTSTYLRTKIFFAVAASISILSTPAPALPITLRFFPASITSAVTFVSDLTMRASYF